MRVPPRNGARIGLATRPISTETCDEHLPHLITNIATTTAATTDAHALPDIHAALAARELLPHVHEVDAGYIDAHVLVSSQERYAVDVVGPPGGDHRWQARQQMGYAQSDFAIDWDQRQASCPEGQVSSSWTLTKTRDQEVIKIKFCVHDVWSLSRTPTVYHLWPSATLGAPSSEIRGAYCGPTASYYQRICRVVTTSARESKGRTPKRYVGADCGAVGTLASHAPICNTWPPLQGINLYRLLNWITGIPPARTKASPFIILMQSAA